MQYPMIRKAVMLAHARGLKTLDDAIRNWDKCVSTGFSAHREITTLYTEMNKEIGKSLEQVQNDTTLYWDLTLQQANDTFKLGIDLTK
jgi:hypothetical protein